MMALGIVGSHRKNGSTCQMVNAAMEAARKVDSSISTQIVQLADMKIEPCRVCGGCGRTNLQCANEDDDLQTVYNMMKAGGGLMFASPLYFPIPSKMVALMERVVSLQYSRMEQDKAFVSPMAGKPACLLSTSGGSPVNLVLFHLLEFATFLQMEIVNSKEWPGFGVAPCPKPGQAEWWVEPLESSREMGIAFAKKLSSQTTC